MKEKEVQQVLTNTYPISTKKEKMIKEGSTQDEGDDWECLSSEITQAISSKQLVPTMRTQYMRTAFQIPFDATVRVSLDTNLCMISERGYDLKNMTVWYVFDLSMSNGIIYNVFRISHLTFLWA